jgi:AAA domain
MLVERYSDKTPVDIEYLVEGIIPFAEVVMIAGPRECGKGMLTAALVGRWTTGRTVPRQTRAVQGTIGMATYEDDPEAVVWKRLDRAGADHKFVLDLTEEFHYLPADEPKLAAICEKYKDELIAVTIDPLNSTNPGLTWGPTARAVIESLQRIAHKYGITIIVLHHTIKDGDIGGAMELQNALRVILKIDRVTDKLRRLNVVKSSNEVPAPPMEFIIQDGAVVFLEEMERPPTKERRRSPAGLRVIEGGREAAAGLIAMAIGLPVVLASTIPKGEGIVAVIALAMVSAVARKVNSGRG